MTQAIVVGKVGGTTGKIAMLYTSTAGTRHNGKQMVSNHSCFPLSMDLHDRFAFC